MYRRHSSRRRVAYIPKPIGVRWLAEIARAEDDARPLWRHVFGDMTVQDALLMSLRFYVLKQCDWCRTQAAEILGISVRSLHNYINEYEQMGFPILQPPTDKCRVNLKNDFWIELITKIENFGD